MSEKEAIENKVAVDGVDAIDTVSVAEGENLEKLTLNLDSAEIQPFLHSAHPLLEGKFFTLYESEKYIKKYL